MPGRVPRVTRTEAIVLRHRRLGEADRVVTLLTPLRGKLDAVAKGALRPRSKLAGHLEPLAHVDVLLAHGRTLDIVTQAQLRDGFPALHADLDRMAAGLYVLELADRLTVDRAEAEPVYALVLLALRRLALGDGLQLVSRSYELALLEASGFRPQWRDCVGCDTPVSAERASWSALAGGVVCRDCLATHAEAVAIDSGVLRVLRAYQDGPYEQAARIRLTAELAAGLERVMHALMRAVTERALGTARFVGEARRSSATAPAGAVAPSGGPGVGVYTDEQD